MSELIIVFACWKCCINSFVKYAFKHFLFFFTSVTKKPRITYKRNLKGANASICGVTWSRKSENPMKIGTDLGQATFTQGRWFSTVSPQTQASVP